MGGERTTDATNEGEPGGGSSRRTLLRVMGAASAIAGVGGLAGAQETTTEGGEPGTTTQDGGETTTAAADATPVVLGGRASGWLGLAPEPIVGERNPTLNLQAGERYRLVWVNLDGERHEWHLEGDEGNVVDGTEAAERVGATRSVAFEATESVGDYLCEYHPERMQGSVEFGQGLETTVEDGTETGEATEDGETTGTDESTDAGETDGTTPAEGEVVEVAVGPEGQYLRFVPEEVEIAVGDTVRWIAESEGHNVTARPEAATQVAIPDDAETFASYEGNRSFMVMEVGATFEHTFTVPGEYVYVCAPHSDQGMIGRVIVSE